ncbi:pyruvate dehydrogenase (acetyl-transferring) E1 component subunit alpha [Microbacter margulisiae]|uniref:Pyruvate dehydrogenase E1 component subunit alpha n=1 Tax=Microbacter margulisiae TaxID=1350067 RepID=A0A7W5DNP2_9PORP|nr:pyruvate dehydrogenase (acetyl-transferring) E1 component subunit alpha [Microbacter margulisiae]MBB3185903.1 pyruvate dehydrogenase E1 component alpha subunit [Microbacter margulisiae]
MIFDEFDPKEDKIFRLIDNEGQVLNASLMPDLDDEIIVKAYKEMLFARVADEMAVSYQRQGRMYTYPPNMGQEAIAVAAGLVIRHEDWLVPVFRELGTWLAKGVSLKEIFLYYMGNEAGSNFKNAHHVLPFSIPIASQVQHAVGIGYSIKLKKIDEVAFTFVGDGGTSEGDFSEALNFAGVWQVPVVFTIQNNQYAISVPVRSQTKSINLAIKSYAFGIPGIKVDGNDFFAMFLAYKEALEYARAGNGSVLIEALTYRKGSHTTSDDPTKYRDKGEETEWAKADPIIRLKKYMDHKGIWKEDETALIEQYRTEVDKQFEEAEHFTPYQLEDVFQHTYVDMPDDLRRQKLEYEQFLTWKENRK